MSDLHPKDKLLAGAPDYGREMFNRFSRAADGFSSDAVLSAALNVIVNALRQTYGTRAQVEARYDELVGRTKATLLGHYDGVTGRRRSTTPFTQHISVPHFIDKDHH